MTEHDIKAVDKILRHCDKLARSVHKVKTYEGFLDDEDAVDASITRVGQIGELSRRELSEEFKRTLPTIPWKSVYAMRNHLVHGYDSIDLPMLWETITQDVPNLAELLRTTSQRTEDVSSSGSIKDTLKPLKFK